MSNETPKTPPKSESTRIASVRTVDSVPFAGTEETSCRVAPGKADSITAVCLMADGSLNTSASHPANGVMLERKVGNGRERVFVAFANSRGITFAE